MVHNFNCNNVFVVIMSSICDSCAKFWASSGGTSWVMRRSQHSVTLSKYLKCSAKHACDGQGTWLGWGTIGSPRRYYLGVWRRRERGGEGDQSRGWPHFTRRTLATWFLLGWFQPQGAQLVQQGKHGGSKPKTKPSGGRALMPAGHESHLHKCYNSGRVWQRHAQKPVLHVNVCVCVIVMTINPDCHKWELTTCTNILKITSSN